MKLINGDCIEELKKLNIENAIIVTDPPFNINYHYNSYKDKMNESDYYNWLGEIFKNRKSVIIHYPENICRIAIEINNVPKKTVSWVYNSNTAKQHRDIAFFNIKPNFNQVKQPYKNPNDKRIKQRILNGSEGGRLYDWWNVNQVKNVSKDKTSHPCQMPIEIMENIIGILPYECTILDPFMGSGTTGVAVVNMNKKQNANRKFIGIEIDKEYFNIAKSRINYAEKEE